MSVFNAAEIACPRCGHVQDVQLVASVNADRRPDLRAAILDRSFQACACAACEATLRLPLHMTYLDMGRGVWVLADAVDTLAQWETLVADARALFAETFGDGAPAAARSLAVGVRPRLVFGWPALREKIICNALGLDDAVVELIKAAVLRGRPDARLTMSQAMRLAGGDEEVLGFEIIDDETEQIFANMEVPRSLYDDIDHDEVAWAQLRITLGREPFCDLKRLMIDGTQVAEALPAG
jgi:CpXC protein